MVIIGCKDQSDSFIENNKVDDISLLRADFEKQTGYDQTKVYLLTPAFRTRINWDKTVEKHKDTVLIAVSVLDTVHFPFDGLQVDLKNHVILKAVRNKDSKWNYSTVTFVPTDLSKGYSGLIISRSLKKGIEKIDYYNEGSILNNDNIIRRKFAVSASKNANKASAGLRAGCIYGYVNGYVNFISCDNYTGTGGSSSQDTYGDPDDFEQMPIFDGEGSPPFSEEYYSITNNVKNPCLKGMVDEVINRDIVFKANETLKSIFGANEKINIIFNESTELESGVNGNAKPTQIFYDTEEKISSIDVSVNLNLNTLPSSSQEYIATVVVHESIHAYLDYKGFLYNTSQHDIMLKNYVGVIANYLVNNFNTPVQDAYSVAFGGLYEAFLNSVNNQTWSSIESQLGNKLPSLNDRSRILADYELGYKGKKCQ